MMIVWVLCVSIIALPPAQGARVNRVASISPQGELSDYCAEQDATYYGKACTCNNGMVCKIGETYGCATTKAGKSVKEKARGELYQFTMEQWQNDENPTCVENPCSEKQAVITYQDDHERWVCECKKEGHCHSGPAFGETHCPVENGLKFAKQFLTSCESCRCKIGNANNFWKKYTDASEALCKTAGGTFDSTASVGSGELICKCPTDEVITSSDGSISTQFLASSSDASASCKSGNVECAPSGGVFDFTASATSGKLTCSCPEGTFSISSDGTLSKTVNPITCPDCVCMSPEPKCSPSGGVFDSDASVASGKIACRCPKLEYIFTPQTFSKTFDPITCTDCRCMEAANTDVVCPPQAVLSIREPDGDEPWPLLDSSCSCPDGMMGVGPLGYVAMTTVKEARDQEFRCISIADKCQSFGAVPVGGEEYPESISCVCPALTAAVVAKRDPVAEKHLRTKVGKVGDALEIKKMLPGFSLEDCFKPETDCSCKKMRLCEAPQASEGQTVKWQGGHFWTQPSTFADPAYWEALHGVAGPGLSWVNGDIADIDCKEGWLPNPRVSICSNGAWVNEKAFNEPCVEEKPCPEQCETCLPPPERLHFDNFCTKCVSKNFAFSPEAHTCKPWSDVLSGLWIAPEIEKRTMQYMIFKGELDTSMTMDVYKTKPGAKPAEEDKRNAEPVPLGCGDASALPDSVLPGVTANALFPCAGEYVYKRHRRALAVGGKKEAQSRIQLIASGNPENPTVYLKELLDNGSADWKPLVRP